MARQRGVYINSERNCIMETKQDERTVKTVVNVTRTFGAQNLLEIYSD